jgi:organic radical activating enzyme
LKLLLAKAAAADSLKVTEHYLCEEGEGSTLGALTYLIRLSGCNLRCTWCDSKQSSFFDDEEKMIAASVLREAALKSAAAWVSFTGGEPTWRSRAELKTLASLCRALRSAGRKIKIESNGLLLPTLLKDCVDLWSLAPKWDGSKPYATQRQPHMDYSIPTLRAFLRNSTPQGLQLKFVICDDSSGGPRSSDLKRVASILGELQGKKRPPVFFIPEAYGKGDYLSRCRRLAEAVEALAPSLKGWDLRVQPQWHRVLFGDERRR